MFQRANKPHGEWSSLIGLLDSRWTFVGNVLVDKGTGLLAKLDTAHKNFNSIVYTVVRVLTSSFRAYQKEVDVEGSSFRLFTKMGHHLKNIKVVIN